MGKVKNEYITDTVLGDDTASTYEPDLSDIEDQHLYEYVGYWVQSGTNYRLSAVGDTPEAVRFEAYAQPYAPKQGTFVCYKMRKDRPKYYTEETK